MLQARRLLPASQRAAAATRQHRPRRSSYAVPPGSRADRAADPLRQSGVHPAAPVEAPGIAPAGTIRRRSKPESDARRITGARKEQRSASSCRTRRSTASRRLPASDPGNHAMRRSGRDTAHLSSRADISSSSAEQERPASRSARRAISAVGSSKIATLMAPDPGQICQRNRSSTRALRIAARSNVATARPGEASAMATMPPEGLTAKE
jgi:hypothetical protein